MIKVECSASLLQSSVSHDPSEIILISWFAAQETFIFLIIIIISVENSCTVVLTFYQFDPNLTDIQVLNDSIDYLCGHPWKLIS